MSGSGVEAGASYGDLLVTSLVVLGAVCIAAFIAVRFFGRFLTGARAHGAHLLDVVARVPLEPRRSLYVVAVAGKTLLVGTSEMGLSVLSELDPAEVKARAVLPQSFADLVRGAWRKRKGLAGAGDGSAATRADAGLRDGSAKTRADSGAANGSAGTRADAGSSDGSAGMRPDAPSTAGSAATPAARSQGLVPGIAESLVTPAGTGSTREDRGA